MRIRKVAKLANETVYKLSDSENEPVCLLHMVAFEFTDAQKNIHYLCANGNDIIFQKVGTLLNFRVRHYHVLALECRYRDQRRFEVDDCVRKSARISILSNHKHQNPLDG